MILSDTQKLVLFVIKTESGTDINDLSAVLELSLAYIKKIIKKLHTMQLIQPCCYGYQITKRGLNQIVGY